MKQALKGETWAIKELADRIDGKVPQAQIIQGDRGRRLGSLHRRIAREGCIDAGMAGKHQAGGHRAIVGDECCCCCR